MSERRNCLSAADIPAFRCIFSSQLFDKMRYMLDVAYCSLPDVLDDSAQPFVFRGDFA